MTDDVPAAPLSVEARIEAAVQQYGQDARYVWDVYALDDKTRRSRLVARVHGLDFDEYGFGVQYGPGDYQRALRVEGVGRVPQVCAVNFTIDARINAPRAQPASTPEPDMPAWAKALAERVTTLAERFDARPAQPPASDDRVGVKDLVVLFQPMIQAAMQPRGEGVGLKDILPLLQQKSTAGELAELLKVAKEIAPGGADDGLGKLGLAFAHILEDARKQEPHVPPPPSPQRQLPSPAPQPAVPPRPQPFPGAASVAHGLRPYLPQLDNPQVLSAHLDRLVSALNDEIEKAGGRIEDVATRYPNPEAFTDAFVAFASDYAPYRPVVLAVARGFHAQFEDEPEKSDAPGA